MSMEAGIWARFWQYQKERYPFLAYLVLIGTFSFSAVSFSRLAAGRPGFIDWGDFAVCVVNTVGLFFLVRIFDEHKDYEDDIRFRRDLPVPRGLISLAELRRFAWGFFALMVLLDAWFVPRMLPFLGLMLGWLGLMGKEFFVSGWLKRNWVWYVLSHMFIIPFVDVYASGFDWILENAEAPPALAWFFGLSYLNGIVLEIGRKIRPAGGESEGVDTFSSRLGPKVATWLWWFCLLGTVFLAWKGLEAARIDPVFAWILLALAGGMTLPMFLFFGKPGPATAKGIEYASALWTLALYLCVGGIPMLLSL